MFSTGNKIIFRWGPTSGLEKSTTRLLNKGTRRKTRGGGGNPAKGASNHHSVLIGERATAIGGLFRLWMKRIQSFASHCYIICSQGTLSDVPQPQPEREIPGLSWPRAVLPCIFGFVCLRDWQPLLSQNKHMGVSYGGPHEWFRSFGFPFYPPAPQGEASENAHPSIALVDVFFFLTGGLHSAGFLDDQPPTPTFQPLCFVLLVNVHRSQQLNLLFGPASRGVWAKILTTSGPPILVRESVYQGKPFWG